MKTAASLKKIYELHVLIRNKTTGTYEELAKKLAISRTSLFELISKMKDYRAAIVYNKVKKTLEYEYIPKFYLDNEIVRILFNDPNRIDEGGVDAALSFDDDEDEKWSDDALDAEEYDICGGSDDWESYGHSDDDDSDEVILDQMINFNDFDLDYY